MVQKYPEAEIQYIATQGIVEGIVAAFNAHPDRIETNLFLTKIAEEFIADLETNYQVPRERLSFLRAQIGELN
mgnify:CR=1 FL=1